VLVDPSGRNWFGDAAGWVQQNPLALAADVGGCVVGGGAGYVVGAFAGLSFAAGTGLVDAVASVPVGEVVGAGLGCAAGAAIIQTGSEGG
jgi:hypothetical protein